MFPRPRQSVAIVAGVAAVGVIYSFGADVARAGDGAEGAVLASAGEAWKAIGTAAGLTAAAAIVAALAAAMGSPVAGAFVIGAGLLMSGLAAGSIDGFLRSAESGEAYWLLAAEDGVWLVVLGAALLGCHAVSRKIRGSLNRYLSGGATPPAEPGAEGESWFIQSPGWVGEPVEVAGENPCEPVSVRQMLGAMGVTAVVGSTAGVFLIRSADVGQVIWPLLVGFLAGGLFAHQSFPRAHGLGILLSPLVAAGAWHGYAAMTLGESQRLLGMYFGGDLIGPAMGLPVHFAAAGLTGAAVGLGWSHALIRNHLIMQAEGAGEGEGL